MGYENCIKFFFICFVTISLSQTGQELDQMCYEYGDIKPDSAVILGKKAIEGCIKEKGKNSVEYEFVESK